MTNSDEAIREIAEAEYPDIPGISERAPYNQIMATNRTNLIARLTALISEHYYPKEFVEWTMMQGIMGIYDRKGYLYSSALLNLKGFKGDNTIKNLFNYWKENVR